MSLLFASAMQRQTSTHQSQICAVANHPALAARLALVAALPLTACFNHGMPLDSTVEVTPGTVMVDAVPAPTLLVTTYNVHRIASEDLLQAFLDTPQLQNADIVLLQEVYKSDECSPACYVANALGRHALYAPGHGVDDGEHSDGVAIISKQPLAHAEVIELPDNHVVVNGGRRIALYAQAQWGARAVHVYAVHLENRINSSARRAQLLPVLQHARALVDRENAAAAQAARAQPLVNRWGVRPPNPRAAQRSTVVIAGDMNTSPFRGASIFCRGLNRKRRRSKHLFANTVLTPRWLVAAAHTNISICASTQCIPVVRMCAILASTVVTVRLTTIRFGRGCTTRRHFSHPHLHKATSSADRQTPTLRSDCRPSRCPGRILTDSQISTNNV